MEESKKTSQGAAVGKNGQIKSNINLSFNNSFNTSFATNNNNNGAASIDQKPPSRTTSANVSPQNQAQAPATVTLEAEAMTAAGTTRISHGPLTIDLSEMEQKVASKLVSPEAHAGIPRTFEDVIGDGG